MDKQELAAYTCAVRALGRREHTAVELRAKLSQRGFPDDVVGPVLERLTEDGYLSEARFAESYLRSRLQAGETPWLAARKARARGVEESALQDALRTMQDAFDPLAACRRLLARRDPAGLRHEDEGVWQKQARFLRNKGFEAATIVHALNEELWEEGEKE